MKIINHRNFVGNQRIVGKERENLQTKKQGKIATFFLYCWLHGLLYNNQEDL